MKNELQKNRNYQEILDTVEELCMHEKFGAALTLLEKIPEDCEEYSASLFMKSMIVGMQDDNVESFEIFKIFLAEEFGNDLIDMDERYKPLDMNDPEELFDYGMFLFYIFEDYEDAIKHFDMSLKIDSNQSEAFYYKALSLAFLGKFKKAVKTIDRAIKLEPDNVRYWNGKGAFLSELNFIEKAHKAFDKALSIESNKYSWANKGMLYCRNDEFDDALSCFERALALDENDMDSIVLTAAIYSELEDYEKADEYFNRAEKIDSTNKAYLAEKGKHLLNQNEFRKSIEYFDRYLKTDDELGVVWMYKSIALSELGRDDESEMCFKRAIELDPNSIDVFDDVVVIEE